MFLLALTATPAVAASKVDLPVRIKAGDSWTQEVVLTHTQQAGAAPPQAWTQTTQTKVTYRGAENGVGRIALNWTKAEATGLAPDFIKAATDLLLPLEIEVDDRLLPTRIRNWEALKAAMVKASEALIPDLAARKAAVGFLEMWDDTTAAPQVLKEQSLLALGQGTSLGLGGKETYESDISNPFGGQPIKATGSYTLVSLDKKSGRASLTWSQDLDPKSATQAVMLLVDRLIASTPAEKQGEARLKLSTMTLSRHDTCGYQIDIATGLVVEADCASEILAGLQDQLGRRADRWRMTQTLPGSQP
ncbi:MAG TPA: hypothetical protein PLV04_00485 [Phenylobacterium sp.]|nr:hypothetical protein [Phenylobacterium sp.]HQP18742.1 hypothetical protein [Phenylobacterium sp.]